MAAPKRKGFFGQTPSRPEDDLARQKDVEALIAPRQTVVQDLPLERIRPNPFQARKQFENLEELAEAIKVQGFTSRLRVRPDPSQDGYFQLVYGERRLRAAYLAGLSSVPCEVANHTDAEMIEIGLAENIQRRDLSPLEEAQAFQTFLTERGYSIRSLAEKIGKDKSYVQDRLEVLRVPTDVQQMVALRGDTLRAAREIAKLPTVAERKPLIDGIIENKINVQDVRAIVAERTNQLTDATQPIKGNGPASPPDPRPTRRDPSLDRVIERDGRLILATLARWQEMFPDLNEPQRNLLMFYVEQLNAELTNFTTD